MKCNFCGIEDNEIINEYTRFERNNVLQCKNCGLVFLELKKQQAELESFYEKEYREVDSLPKKSAEEMFNHPVIRQDCKNRIEWINEEIGNINGKKILEIGSSSGYFLDTLSSAGAKVAGVELTESYSNYARGLGFTVYSKAVEDLGFEAEFDLAVTFHTLEHVFDPMSVLHAIHKLLKRNGVFMGEVPNQDDWRLKIFDNEVVKRFHYDPFHYYYYSPQTLTNYLEKCGFSDITLRTVERYNSFIQLRRILCGEYSQDNVDEVLKKDIFAQSEQDVRLSRLDNYQEIEFNRIYGEGVNSALMGNCLRWIAVKG